MKLTQPEIFNELRLPRKTLAVACSMALLSMNVQTAAADVDGITSLGNIRIDANTGNDISSLQGVIITSNGNAAPDPATSTEGAVSYITVIAGTSDEEDTQPTTGSINIVSPEVNISGATSINTNINSNTQINTGSSTGSLTVGNTGSNTTNTVRLLSGASNVLVNNSAVYLNNAGTGSGDTTTTADTFIGSKNADSATTIYGGNTTLSVANTSASLTGGSTLATNGTTGTTSGSGSGGLTVYNSAQTIGNGVTIATADQSNGI